MIPHLFMMLGSGGGDILALEAEGGGSPPAPNPHSFTYRKYYLLTG
jgi:hypothetical protein